MGKITLVGTVHEDIRGPARIKRMIKELKPEIITLESTWDNYRNNIMMQNCFERIRRTPFIGKKRLRKFFINEKSFCAYKESINLDTFDEWALARGYEDWASCKYSKRKTKLFQVESPEFQKKALRELEDEKDPYYFLRLSPNEQMEDTMSQYEECREHKYTGTTNAFFIERDVYMSKQIKEIYDKNSDKNIVHVGGAAHSHIPGRMFDIIGENCSDAKISRELLCDFD